MTTYKAIKVYDGSEWQNVGARVPQVLEAYGSESVTLVGTSGSDSVTFTSGLFATTPLVFLQLTGTEDAVLRLSSVSSTGFTASISNADSDATVTYSWFAIQTA